MFGLKSCAVPGYKKDRPAVFIKSGKDFSISGILTVSRKHCRCSAELISAVAHVRLQL